MKDDKAVNRKYLMDLIGEASSIHGHTCPSLVYGCRLAQILLADVPPGTTVKSLVLRHTSSCMLDGCRAVLKIHNILTDPVSSRESGHCSLEAVFENKKVLIRIRQSVREKINELKNRCRLEEFRALGVRYLLSLTDDEFYETIPVHES